MVQLQMNHSGLFNSNCSVTMLSDWHQCYKTWLNLFFRVNFLTTFFLSQLFCFWVSFIIFYGIFLLQFVLCVLKTCGNSFLKSTPANYWSKTTIWFLQNWGIFVFTPFNIMFYDCVARKLILLNLDTSFIFALKN